MELKHLQKIGLKIAASALCLVFLSCGADSGANIYEESGENEVDPEVTLDAEFDKASEVIDDFRTFLDENNISEGAIAISYKGKLVAKKGIDREPTDNAAVASLSKAITAVCTIKALEQNNLEFSATLQEIMPETLQAVNAGTALEGVTIEQLLLHTSGIQGAHISELGPQIPTMYLEQKLWQFEYIATQGLSAEPGVTYFYANANYLILGLAIESITGEDYEPWCKREVLLPVGIEKAQISPYWTVFTSYAGWEISALDYLVFITAYFKPDDMVGLNPKTTTVFEWIDEKRRYGPGTLYRLISTGAIFWHAGSFQWQSEEQSGRFGAYYVLPNGFAATVNLSDSLDEIRVSEIDRILYQLAVD